MHSFFYLVGPSLPKRQMLSQLCMCLSQIGSLPSTLDTLLYSWRQRTPPKSSHSPSLLRDAHGFMSYTVTCSANFTLYYVIIKAVLSLSIKSHVSLGPHKTECMLWWKEGKWQEIGQASHQGRTSSHSLVGCLLVQHRVCVW